MGSTTTRIILTNMRVAIVLAIICFTPAVLGDLDLNKIFGKFSPPFKCGQCRSAFSEAKNQFCEEIDVTFPFVDFVGACKELLKLAGAPIAKVFCTPFGLCTGAGDDKAVIECDKCPDAIRNAFNTVCQLVPIGLENVLNPKGTCQYIIDRLSDSDLAYVCNTAGFCENMIEQDGT